MLLNPCTFSPKPWITLDFTEKHIFRIYMPRTLLECIWFPWNISLFNLNWFKARRDITVPKRKNSFREEENRVCCTFNNRPWLGAVVCIAHENASAVLISIPITVCLAEIPPNLLKEGECHFDLLKYPFYADHILPGTANFSIWVSCFSALAASQTLLESRVLWGVTEFKSWSTPYFPFPSFELPMNYLQWRS